MRKKQIDYFGIPKKACFLFMDENDAPITKVWILGPFILYRNYTKDIMKRVFGKKRIVFLNDVKIFLCTRSIPYSRNLKEYELAAYDLSYEASHWEIVKALGGRTMADRYSIRFLW